jgi:hypothetical protein
VPALRFELSRYLGAEQAATSERAFETAIGEGRGLERAWALV